MESTTTVLKSKLKDMLKWFHDFCVENDLRYYLSSGTMLGAARHQGFIPWDDDVDVMMPREDLKKLSALLSADSGKAASTSRYALETPASPAKDFCYSYAKLYDTTTTLIENTKYKIKRGIYIDIFPIDGFGNTVEEAQKHLKKVRFNYKILLCKVGGFRKRRGIVKNTAIALFRIIPLSEKKLIAKITALCEKYSWNDVELSGNSLGVYGMKEIMPKYIYGEPTLYKFEDIEVYGVEKYDEYLSRLYGDWRKLPPEEKRTNPHLPLLLDLNNGYMGDNV